MSHVDPIIGNWSRNEEPGNDSEVVALDEGTPTIEIQYFAGEVEELALDAWYEVPLEAIESPDDWAGPFDGLEEDELGYEEGEELSDEDDLLADRDED